MSTTCALLARPAAGPGISAPPERLLSVDGTVSTGGHTMDTDRALRRLDLLDRRAVAVAHRDRERTRRAIARTVAERGAELRTGYRGPNTAVPIRTMVAPSQMASSRSPDMPIDSSTAWTVAAPPEATASSRIERNVA